MHKLNIFLKIIFCCAVFLSLGKNVRADNVDPLASALCDQGQRYYERGQKQEAIEEFSRAVLVDPNNQTAKDSLRKLGLNGGIHQPLKTITVHALRRESMSTIGQERKVFKLQPKIISPKENSIAASKLRFELKELKGSLDQAHHQLKEQTQISSNTINSLQQKLSEKNENRTKQQEAFEKKMTFLKDTVAHTDRKLDRLNDAILMRDLDLLNSDSTLVLKNQEILALRESLKHSIPYSNNKPMDDKESSVEADAVSPVEQEINDIKAQIVDQKKELQAKALKEKNNHSDLTELIKEKDQQIAGLKENLAQLKKKEFLLEKNATPQEHDAQTQIQNAQLELSEKELALKEQEKNILDLQKQLNEIIQRQDLSQKILAEKDSQIKKLVEDLQSAQDQCSPQQTPPSPNGR